MTLRRLLFTGLLLASSMLANAQIVVDNTTQTPEQLVQNILTGTGVAVSNVEFNYSGALATTVQSQVGYFDASTTTFPITEGVVMGTGDVTLAIGPNDQGGATDNNGVATDPNDPDLAQIGAPYTMNNEAILEFDFVPEGDSVVFNYIFASEEYHEYSTSQFNDGFGFIISGPGFAGPFQNGGENIAIIPNTSLPVTMNNLNNGSTNSGPCNNCQYLVDNPTGSPDLQYDAHTTTLQAAASVQCGQTYHIKLVIGDAGDMSFDSAVFLEANSFSSNGVQVQIASATGSAAVTEGCDSALVSFIRPTDSTALSINYQVGGSATNGTDYPFLNGQANFSVGQDSIGFYITPTADAQAEGPETITITVEIVNACGDTVTSSATIEIVDAAPYNVLTNDVLLNCPQDSVQITADTDGGTPPLTYDWGANGTGQSIYVPGDIVGTTTYNVDVSDGCGQTFSGSVDVTLNPAPQPTINFNNNTFSICPNDSAFIDATVINPYDPSSLTYDWQPTGETTEDITVSPNSLTWYYLTINDGCYDVTDSVKVEMGSINVTDISITNATNCPGQPGTPGEIQVTPDNSNWSYTLDGAGNTIGPQPSGYFNNLQGGVTYFLHVVSDDGCTIDTAVTVGLGSNAVTATWIADSLRHVTCFGDNNGGAYVDDIDGGITPPYDVTWTHSTSGLHFSETVTGVNGSPADPDSEVDDLYGGQWVVTVTDQEGCAWSQLFDIDEPDELLINWNASDPNCYQFSDGSVTMNISGGNGGYTYNIKDSTMTVITSNLTANLLSEGMYYGEVTDSEGCSVTDSVFIDDPDQLDIDLTINQPICYGQPAGNASVDTVYNYIGAYDSLYYIWEPNPSAIPNGQGASFINKLGPQDYTITINDENGCSREFDFTIVYPEEFILYDSIRQQPLCRTDVNQNGNGVIFAETEGGTGGATYLWTDLQNGDTWTNSTWGTRNPGYYSITATDQNGCIVSDTIRLDSLNPIADFNLTSSQLQPLSDSTFEGTAEVCIEFSNASLYFANPFNPNSDTSFLWNFNHNVTPDAGWIVDTSFYTTYDTCYTSSGEHEICLVAKNKNGCKDTACKLIIVHDQLSFTPVNVFTPNGDGTNDYFTFYDKSVAVEEFNCIIVDRWGKTVFVMNDITDQWDGKNDNGKTMNNGVYFYTYEGVSTDGTEFSGQGTVTLVDQE